MGKITFGVIFFMKKKNALLLFVIGGLAYVGLEFAYRKRSHYSMFFVGGASVLLIDLVCNIFSPVRKAHIALKALAGGIIITLLEFVSGLLVNVKLGLGVWDYSDIPYNLKGQICPRSSAVWTVLSVPVIYFGKLFNKKR